MEEVGEHSWNAVEIDGKWYFTDITWDAKQPEEIPNCLMVSEEFMKSHQLDARSMLELQKCTFANADYSEDNPLIEMMQLCYEKLNLKSVIEGVKSHRIEKKKIKTQNEMSIAELVMDLFGSAAPLNNPKSLNDDYPNAVACDPSYRLGSINNIAQMFTHNVHNLQTVEDTKEK